MCYFVNLALLVFMWAFPTSPEYFQMVFALTHGPLLVAVILFHNSLVFHSVDKITSLLIHLTPPLVTHSIRWWSPWTSIYGPDKVPTWIPDFADAVRGAEENWSPRWLVLAPVLFVIGHQTLYFIFVQLLPNKKLKADRTMLTTYRVLTSNRKTPLWKFVNMFGRPGRVPLFAVINITFCALTISLSLLLFNNYWANLAALLLGATMSVWNGAGYYINFFAHRYEYARGKEVLVPKTAA